MDPKVLYKWLDGINEHSGKVPGTDLVIKLTKNENGLTGNLLGYTFTDCSQVKLAVALGSIIEVRGLAKAAPTGPKILDQYDPLFSNHPGIQSHADYHDYSFLLPEPLKLGGHRLVLDQPKLGPNSDPALSAPAVHLVGPDNKIKHNHVWDHGKSTFDNPYDAQKTGTTQAVQAAFNHHLNSGPKAPPAGPPKLSVVKSEPKPLRKEYRPKLLTTGGPGGFIPKTPPIPNGEAEIKIDANRKEKPALELKPGLGGARKINLPGIKPLGDRPGPDNHLEAAVAPVPAKNPVLKVNKAIAHQPCSICGLPQIKGTTFTGCACYAGLSKSVSVKVTPKTYELSFGDGWDVEAISALDLAFKGS